LATGIVANYFFLEDGDQPHEWLGYVLCALIVCRILWGFFGPASARFASFLRRPSTLWQELTGLATAHELPDTHTTAGGYQLILVMILIAGLGITGWMHDLDAFWGEDWPAEVHELLANALIVLASLHVAAIMWMQWVLKMPIIRRMWFRKT
jgi:cytochrome b